MDFSHRYKYQYNYQYKYQYLAMVPVHGLQS